MEVVLDTVCMNSLLRSPRAIPITQDADPKFETSIDSPIISGQLTLFIDEAGGLLDEWKRTCGAEPIQVLITKWEKGIRTVPNPPSLDAGIARALRQRGFDGGIDKLILRIAMCTNDKTVISNDPDFWNPSNPQERGNHLAPITSLCRDRLGITIWLLIMLMDFLTT